VSDSLQAVILCGGKGTRLREHTEFRPKPLVTVGERPILWHIMRIYAEQGVNRFVLCLGPLGDQVRDYFLNFASRHSDLTVTLGPSPTVSYSRSAMPEDGWTITLVETGAESMTGARLKRASRHLDPGKPFLLTYGDGLADWNLEAALAFHREHGKLATMTGVAPPSRFGVIKQDGSRVVEFDEKTGPSAGVVNGGFFVLEPGFLDYVQEEESCVLEGEPIQRCVRDDQLRAYSHPGFWQCMDTSRDHETLERLWASGQAPWKTWA
jgi:glucose-1-phosphate cytidylyltransferase